MPAVGFEPTIPAEERPQTYALDRAVTVTGVSVLYVVKITVYVDTTSVRDLELANKPFDKFSRNSAWESFKKCSRTQRKSSQ